MQSASKDVLSGITAGPFRWVAECLSLAPATLVHALVMLGALFLLNDLVRTTLMPAGPTSRRAHLAVCVLTLFPAFVLAGVLLWAGYRHPERAWINMLLAAALFVPWWAGGTLTKLARPDTEGADVGWMAMGALVTFPAGFVAALIF